MRSPFRTRTTATLSLALVLLVPIFAAAGRAGAAQVQTTRFEMAALGKNTPVVFEARTQDVTTRPNGRHVKGTLWVHTPAGNLAIHGCDVLFEHAPGEPDQFTRVRGNSFVPAPYVSDHISIKNPVTAELGMDFGRNIKLDIPLNPGRSYLFFHFDAGLEMSIGFTGDAKNTKPLTLSVPPGVKATLILDPQDPFYYLGGAIAMGENKKNGDGGGKGKDGHDDADIEYGFGRSENGWIPFRPLRTAGLEDKIKPFSGHRLERGRLPLFKLPLEIEGERVVNVQPLDRKDGIDPLGLGFGPSARVGANGRLHVSWKFLKLAKVGKIADFGFELGEASAAAEITKTTQHAWITGTLDPDLSWIPDFVPIRPRTKLDVVGYVSTDAAESFFDARGTFLVDAGRLSGQSGVKLNVLEVAGSLHADAKGFRLIGKTASDLGPIGFEGQASVDVFISTNPDASYLVLRGELRIGGIQANGSASVRAAGVRAGFAMQSPQLTLAASGSITYDPGAKAIVYAGKFNVPPQLNVALDDAIAAEIAAARKEYDAATANLAKATDELEFEVSLRGMRAVIPKLADAIVEQIDTQIPRRINERWPKQFGIEAPGKGLALSEAQRQAKPYRDLLVRLARDVRSKDDAKVRAAIKSALKEAIAKQHLKISVAVIGVVYEADLFTDAQVKQLQAAIAAVDAIPAKSDAKIKAARILGAIPVSEALDDLAKDMKSGGKGAAPRVESIGFRMPVGANASALSLSVRIVRGGGIAATTVNVAFNPARPQDLPAIIADALVKQLK